ncbi:unnamed protein product [Vicia faba]|uniref:Uncharacterized protein n=1 Tax=Vicia faba TaxID=3906 RepID=A0AAV0ZTM5_VICFA|nr:unnamed protein product [Vicia faba]
MAGRGNGRNDDAIAEALGMLAGVLGGNQQGAVIGADRQLGNFQRNNPPLFKGAHDPEEVGVEDVTMSVKQMNLAVKDGAVVFMLYSAIEAEGKTKSDGFPVVNEFPEVFPEDLPFLIQT